MIKTQQSTYCNNTLTIVNLNQLKDIKNDQETSKIGAATIVVHYCVFFLNCVFAALQQKTQVYCFQTVPYTKYGNVSILSVRYCMEKLPYSRLSMDIAI